MIPPGYTGEIPDGYFLLKPPTNRNFLFLRGSIKDGLKPAVENIRSKLKVDPLKDAENPVATEFVNLSNKAFNTVFPSDFSYFEALNQVIQDEPIDAISPKVRGAIAYHPRFDGVRIYPDDPNSVWSTAFANRNTSFKADWRDRARAIIRCGSKDRRLHRSRGTVRTADPTRSAVSVGSAVRTFPLTLVKETLGNTPCPEFP